jgi:hypothetical protein
MGGAAVGLARAEDQEKKFAEGEEVDEGTRRKACEVLARYSVSTIEPTNSSEKNSLPPSSE